MKKARELEKNPMNPRKISDEEKKLLGESMDRFGDLSGIVYNVETGMLVAGHQRAELLGSSQVTVLNDYEEPTEVGTLALGYIENADGEKFPYREVLWDRKTEAEAMIAANKIGGEFDNESLNKFFDEMGSDIEISHTGFDENILRGKFDESILDNNDSDEFSFHNTISGMDASNSERVSENVNEDNNVEDDSKQIIKDRRVREPKEKREKNLLAFSYYGGKFKKLNFILPNLPKSRMFIDVFGGSASVILNKKPSSHNIYNDLNSRICTFFRQLRDNSDELIRLLKLTPYSREEFEKSFDDGKFSDVEIARKFFVQISMVFNSILSAGKSGWKSPNLLTTRSYNSSYSDRVDNLELLVERLRTIAIENSPAIEIIKRYDNKETLFYIDPPYVFSERQDNSEIYDYEMTDEEHIELIELLKNIDARAAISGYDSKLYNEHLDGWFKIKNKVTQTQTTRHTGNLKYQTEILWLNFDPETQEYDE